MDLKVGDVFILRLPCYTYRIKIISINDFRPPDMKYGCDIMIDGSNHNGIDFFGDDFFETYKNNLERIKEY